MKTLFITSISKEYWYNTAQYCIPTWDLPGDVLIYIDQKEGDVDWFNELPYEKRLLYVPPLEIKDDNADKTKIYKFWGKSSAQIYTVYNNTNYDRIIWIDADVQQIAPVPQELFEFKFDAPLGMLYTKHTPDAWETGIVIFNNEFPKLKVVMNKYREAWNDPNVLFSLWKPYDAEVLGLVAQDRGYFNMCDSKCINADAFEHSRFKFYFKHWINKTNKQKLKDENS